MMIETPKNYFLNFNRRDLLDLIFFCNCIIPYSKPSAVGGHPNDDDDDEHNEDYYYNNHDGDDDDYDDYHDDDHNDDDDDDIDGNYDIEEGRS